MTYRRILDGNRWRVTHNRATIAQGTAPTTRLALAATRTAIHAHAQQQHERRKAST